MSKSYCGKCCTACAFAEQIGCPGCKAGAYRPMAAQCAIATCCRTRGHESCETCTSHATCPTLSKKDANPEAILQKLADLRQKKEAEAEAAALATILSLVQLIPSLVGMYYEINTFAEILEDTDRELSEKWRKLWKTFLICTGVTFGSLVLMLLAPRLAALAILGGAIGMLVVAIQEYVYIYRTAQVYRSIDKVK